MELVLCSFSIIIVHMTVYWGKEEVYNILECIIIIKLYIYIYIYFFFSTQTCVVLMKPEYGTKRFSKDQFKGKQLLLTF